MPTDVQPNNAEFQEWLATEYVPIAGGSPEADGGGEGAPPPGVDGQGEGEATGSDLYDLEQVPPELREQVVPHLKAIDANVTKRFQEAAEYRKTWEPFEQIGLTQYDPTEIQGLLEWAEMANDPEQFAAWWRQVGQEQGLFDGQDGTNGEMVDDELGGFPDLDPEAIKQMVSDAVAERVNPVYEQLQRQEQEALEQAEYDKITERLSEIRADNPDLPDNADEVIMKLAFAYVDDESGDPIGKAFEDYKATFAQGEQSLFAQKSQQPGPTEGPGSADTSAPPITSFDEAKVAAMERLKASHTT